MISDHLISPQTLASIPELMALANQSQSVVGQRCLHADFEWRGEVVAAENANEVFYAAIRDDAAGKWIGLYGAEIALDLARAWLRGPFVAAHPSATFEQIAQHALDALRARFDREVSIWDAYLETSNQRALDCLSAVGFETLKRNAVYSVERDVALARFDSRVSPISSQWLDPVVQLTAEAFPGGYLTREDFAAPGSEEATTFTIVVGGALVGCVHVSREPGSSEGYIDYLVVRADRRGAGYGRALVGHALAWAFAQPAVNNVALTVVAGNSAAMSLYESVGFRRIALGDHLRLRVGG